MSGFALSHFFSLAALQPFFTVNVPPEPPPPQQNTQHAHWLTSPLLHPLAPGGTATLTAEATAACVARAGPGRQRHAAPRPGDC